MTLDEIKQEARNQNGRDLYVAIVHLCEYIAIMEKTIEDLIKSNQSTKVVKPKKEITKKGTK